MDMSIVDYESNDNTCVNDSDDFDDEFNIYEKIQMLLFLNQYNREISFYNKETDCSTNISLDNKKTKPIPIPNKKKYHP